MKKLVAIVLALCSVSAMAQWRHDHYRPYYRNDWVAPAIITGIIGYEIARNQQAVIVQQNPVIIQQPVVVQSQTVCTEWKEIQTADGAIYRERSCFQR